VSLDPDAAAVLSSMQQQGLAPMETLTPQEVRDRTEAAVALSAGSDAPVASVDARDIGGVPCLVVTPEGSGPFHVLVWFHGGGWVIGSAAQSLHSAKDLAAGAGVVVVVPDYRLAPEHPFPGAFDDAVAVTRATIAQAAELGGGADVKVAVGGDSAGGNLAAVAALYVPGLSHQTLAYPVTDATMSQPSYTSIETGYILTAAAMRWFVELYVREADPTDPRISPLHSTADALSQVCPAHVVIAGYDPLADEGAAYAERLREAGVAVTVARYDGQMHGFLTMGSFLPTGVAAMNEAIEHLRSALGSSPSGNAVASATGPSGA
jgi:acetyl esterase